MIYNNVNIVFLNIFIYQNRKSLIFNKDAERKKFFVIDDIIKFINLYNEKYKSDIDLDFILQCDDELNKIIETISNETLDLLFDNNHNLNEDIEEHSLLNDDDNN